MIRIPSRALPLQRVSRAAIGSVPICQTFPKGPLRRLPPPPSRCYSSIPPQTPPPTSEPQISKPSDLRSQFAGAPIQQPPQANRPKRSLRPYIYATLFFIFGSVTGGYVRMIVAPPPLPEAGSKEDILMVEYLHKQAEKLPIVQSLSADPSWVFHDAYASVRDEDRARALTTGPLAGARALGGFQRIFNNKDTGECVAVVWFGGALAGWPGVTHGGLVATIMDELLGRCAIAQFPSRTGVTANLEINYLKPITTNSFYVIRTFLVKEGFTNTKGWVSGRLETTEGKVYVEAKGLFVVPKKYQTMAFGEKF